MERISFDATLAVLESPGPGRPPSSTEPTSCSPSRAPNGNSVPEPGLQEGDDLLESMIAERMALEAALSKHGEPRGGYGGWGDAADFKTNVTEVSVEA